MQTFARLPITNLDELENATTVVLGAAEASLYKLGIASHSCNAPAVLRGIRLHPGTIAETGLLIWDILCWQKWKIAQRAVEFRFRSAVVATNVLMHAELLRRDMFFTHSRRHVDELPEPLLPDVMIAGMCA